MHFFKKRNLKQWVWLALDTKTREIVGLHVGQRDRQGAQGLWNSLPQNYRDNALFFTDYWDAYSLVFPKNRHRSVSKQTGKTNHIERFNNTLRQRLSRLVRKSLSFSKKIENLIGSLFFFMQHYNASLQL